MVNFQNVILAFPNAIKGIKYADTQICEDYYWGVLTHGIVKQNPRIEGIPFPQTQLLYNNIIVVIAESPHISEYVFANGRCVGYKSPLHRCDNRINNYFSKNVNNWFNTNLDYDIVIVNAIQYQCSFGLKLWGNTNNQNQRDKVFGWTWNNELALNDLLYRINKIIKNKKEVILLNSCTAKLKKYCNSAFLLSTNIINQNHFVFDEKHPSRW